MKSTAAAKVGALPLHPARRSCCSLIFLVYPAILTIRMSLDTGAGLRLTKFVGLDNFRQLFDDRLFLDVRKCPAP